MSHEVITVQRSLSLLGDAKRALAQASSVEQAKSVLDQTATVHDWLQRIGVSFDVQQQAAEGVVRGQRRVGEFLRNSPSVKPGRPKLSHGATFKSDALSDLGIKRDQSSRWQSIARLPEKVFEGHIALTKEKGEELTARGVLTLARKHDRRNAVEDLGPIEACAVSDLEAVARMGVKFRTIYADPPWRYGNQGTRASSGGHYKTMTAEEIAALPIRQLADEQAHLHLWTTNAFLFEAKDILEAWGFEYKSVFVWVKDQMGIGNYWRVSHEFLLLGVRGGLVFEDHSQMSWLQVPRTKHSVKPPEVRSIIEDVSPNPRLELFGRETADGWVVWGNEIKRDLFNGAAFEVAHV